MPDQHHVIDLFVSRKCMWCTATGLDCASTSWSIFSPDPIIGEIKTIMAELGTLSFFSVIYVRHLMSIHIIMRTLVES